MPQSSKLGQTIIIASAGVGLVIGALELYERMPVFSDADTRAGAAQQTIVPSQNSRATNTETTPATTAITTEPTVKKSEPDLEETPPPEEHTKFTGRVTALLQNMGCADFRLTDVSITHTFTPASDTTSGFDASYVEGAARLLIGTSPDGTSAVSIYHDVKGTGKGPRAEGAAYDMAARSMLRGFADSPEFEQNCKGFD